MKTKVVLSSIFSNILYVDAGSDVYRCLVTTSTFHDRSSIPAVGGGPSEIFIFFSLFKKRVDEMMAPVLITVEPTLLISVA